MVRRPSCLLGFAGGLSASNLFAFVCVSSRLVKRNVCFFTAAGPCYCRSGFWTLCVGSCVPLITRVEISQALKQLGVAGKSMVETDINARQVRTGDGRFTAAAELPGLTA